MLRALHDGGLNLGSWSPAFDRDRRVMIAPGGDAKGARPAGTEWQRDVKRGRVLVEHHRRKRDEPVGHEGAPQIDWLTPRPDQRNLNGPRTGWGRSHASDSARRARKARAFIRLPQTAIEHHFAERLRALS